MASASHILGSGEQESTLNADRLSGLPQDVLSNIYGRLTLVDGVRTSVLAKDWRYKWLCQSGFTFDSDVIAGRLSRDDVSWETVASAVNKFLRHHTNSIKSFSLKSFCSEHYPDMYQWMEYLSKQDVEVLLIRDLCYSYFKMPSCLFSFENLKSLSLTTCAVRIPSTFTIFSCLVELILRDVSISDADLSHLIKSCPLLENLTLQSIYGLKYLMIHAPVLSKLIVDSGFEDFFIEPAPGLDTVTILAAFREPGDRAVFNWHSFIRCLSGLDALQTLVLPGDIVQLLAADYGLDNFPLRNDAVEYLTLNNVRFENVEVIRVCLSLLSSCHNIRCFRFTIKSAKSPKLSAKFIRENWGRFCFSKLERITVVCPAYTDMGCVENIVDFIISQSPNLMFLYIQKEGVEMPSVLPLINLLERYRSSCPHALVHYELNEKLLPL